MKKIRIALTTTSCAFVVFAVGCSKSDSTDSDIASTGDIDDLPERFLTEERLPIPSFAEGAKSAEFQKAIQDAVRIFGSQPKPLESPYEGETIAGGVSFDVSHEKVEALLQQTHTNFLARGFYVFRYDQNYGLGDMPDHVGLIPTTDKYAVMAAMETNGINWGIETSGVIAWMKELEAEHPYILTGIGGDYMEGHFTPPIKGPAALAKRMYQFCPDIVDQGVETMPRLEAELRIGNLYFWWD